MLYTTLILLTAGCSSQGKFSSERSDRLEGDAGTGLFRIDIHPSAEDTVAEEGGPVYLTQSVLTSASNEERLDIVMKAAVRVSGTVTGWAVTPWLSPNLPGTDNPIPASMSISKPDSSQSYFFTADEDGQFEAMVVPETDYAMTITPHSVGSVFTTLALEAPEGQDVVFDVNLEYGQTLWGRVLDPDGQGMEDVGIYAEDLEGHQGRTAYTSSTGYFSLRVEPGDYYLNTLGRTTEYGRDPVLRANVSVVDGSDQRLDFAYESLASHSVGGRVVDESGNGLKGVSVRFGSQKLYGFESASVEADANVTILTNKFGNFDTRLAPGEYEMWVLPPSNIRATGSWSESIVVSTEMSIGQIPLADMVEVTGIIEDPLGLLPGSRIQCEEQAPGVRYWTTVASEEALSIGQYVIELPQSQVTCAVSPPGGKPELAITRISFTPETGLKRDIRLSTGTEIFGLVSRSDNKPFAYALVQVYSLADDLLGTAITDSDGNYSVSIELERL
jgi:hypothetical protein